MGSVAGYKSLVDENETAYSRSSAEMTLLWAPRTNRPKTDAHRMTVSSKERRRMFLMLIPRHSALKHCFEESNASENSGLGREPLHSKAQFWAKPFDECVSLLGLGLWPFAVLRTCVEDEALARTDVFASELRLRRLGPMTTCQCWNGCWRICPLSS